MEIDFIGPVLQFVSRDLVQELAALIRILQFVDLGFRKLIGVCFDELNQPDGEHKLPPD